MTIRLLLVDDQALFREGLRILLSVHDDLAVVGEAADGKEALGLAAKLKPAVILMDLRMPVLDGVEATRRVRQEHPQTAVIVLTTFDEIEVVGAAIDDLRYAFTPYIPAESPEPSDYSGESGESGESDEADKPDESDEAEVSEEVRRQYGYF